MTVLDRPTPPPLALVGVLLGTVLAALLFAAGWSASKLVLAVLWCAAAIRLGWDDARHAGGS